MNNYRRGMIWPILLRRFPASFSSAMDPPTLCGRQTRAAMSYMVEIWLKQQKSWRELLHLNANRAPTYSLRISAKNLRFLDPLIGNVYPLRCHRLLWLNLQPGSLTLVTANPLNQGRKCEHSFFLPS